MLRDICFDPSLFPPSRSSVNRPLIPVFCYYSFTKKGEDRTGTSTGVGIVDPQLSSGYIDAVLRVSSSVLPDTVHAVVECRIQLLMNATEKHCCQCCRGIGAPPSGKKDEHARGLWVVTQPLRKEEGHLELDSMNPCLSNQLDPTSNGKRENTSSLKLQKKSTST